MVDDARPRVLLGQRRADERVGHAPHLPHAADRCWPADFIFSGFGSIQRYDNMFGPSNFNAEDIDDFLAMQRDWGVDGGLRTVRPSGSRRCAGAGAGRAGRLPRTSAWPTSRRRTGRAGGRRGRSKDLRATDPMTAAGRGDGVIRAARADRGRRGRRAGRDAAYRARGRADHGHARARLAGDYLQTSAIFDEQLRVLSLVTDPNDYAGPGTGYEPLAGAAGARSTPIRQARGGRRTCAPSRQAPRSRCSLRRARPRRAATRATSCIGVSPAVGPRASGGACPGLTVGGRAARAARRVWRRRAASAGWSASTTRIDLGLIGLTAARLSGSGIGIGLQGKGTALIHRRDLAAAGQPGAVQRGAAASTAALYRAARRQRRAGTPRAARRPGQEPVLRRGHRGPLPHHGDRPDGTGAPPHGPGAPPKSYPWRSRPANRYTTAPAWVLLPPAPAPPSPAPSPSRLPDPSFPTRAPSATAPHLSERQRWTIVVVRATSMVHCCGWLTWQTRRKSGRCPAGRWRA